VAAQSGLTGLTGRDRRSRLISPLQAGGRRQAVSPSPAADERMLRVDARARRVAELSRTRRNDACCIGSLGGAGRQAIDRGKDGAVREQARGAIGCAHPAALRQSGPVTAPEKLDDVLEELGAFIRGELAATQIAIGCLRTVAHRALTEFEGAHDQTATRLLGTDVPGSGWIATVHGLAGARALVAEMAEGGVTHQRLTQQWIVTVYTGWDAEFRGRLAAVHEVDKEQIRADFFGDLRHLRNDIVHHRGLASREHSTRCRTVVRRSLRPGDPIYLRDDELQAIHLLVPWATLVKPPAT